MIRTEELPSVDRAEPGDLVLFSVTSIIGVLGKDALAWAAARETGEHAVTYRNEWLTKAERDPAGVVNDLARVHRDKWDAQRDLGSVVHAAIEQLTLTGSRPAVDGSARPYLDAFDSWLQRAQPDFEAAEMVVLHPDYGYCGTIDAIAKIGGTRFVVDYKTKAKALTDKGKATQPYPEQVGLQLAAYAHAAKAVPWRARRVEAKFSPRLYALSAEELDRCVEMPEVDAGLCVHITPDHAVAYPIRLGPRPTEDPRTDDPFRAFLHAIELYRWVKETSKTVMGSPLDLPERRDDADQGSATSVA